MVWLNNQGYFLSLLCRGPNGRPKDGHLVYND